MANRKTNTFDGTNNTTITTGNSALPDALTQAIIGAGASNKYTTADSAHGTACCEIIHASGVATYNRITLAAGGARIVAVAYLKIPATITANEYLFTHRSTGAGMMTIRVNTNKTLVAQNAVGSDISGSTSAALTSNVWYRVEWAATKGTGTTDGVIEYRYAPMSTEVVAETFTLTGVNAGTADGINSNAGRGVTSPTGTHTIRYDDFAVDTLASGWIGPWPYDSLSGAASSVSTTGGALGLTSPQTYTLTGSAASGSAATGDLGLSSPVTGAAVSSSTSTGSVTGSGVLTGAAVSSSTATGAVTATGAIAGAAVSGSTTTGMVTTVGVLPGAAAASTSATGGVINLVGGPQTYPLTGSASSASATIGAVTAWGALTATVVSASSATGQAILAGVLAGTAVSSSVTLGGVRLSSPADGTAVSLSSTTGDMAGRYPLAGAALSTSVTSGAIDDHAAVPVFHVTIGTPQGRTLFTVGGPRGSSLFTVGKAQS